MGKLNQIDNAIIKQEFIIKNLTNSAQLRKARKKLKILWEQYYCILGKRLRTLDKLYSDIFDLYPIRPLKHGAIWTDGYIILHYDEEFGNQAEIKDSWHLSLNEKIKLHAKLLKFLQNKYTIPQIKLEMLYN